jgi:hypothetical protein
MIKRLLPEYMGGHAQPGYMLDVCKMCLQELQERPYNPVRSGQVGIRSIRSPQAGDKLPAIPGQRRALD